MVVSRQFPFPEGSLETSKSNCMTGFLARLLFMSQDSEIWDKVVSDRFYDHQPPGAALHDAHWH